MSVTYTLQDDNAIRLDYDGVSDKKTVINVTNHSYFNLGGHDSGSICDERIRIDADGFTEILPGAIPTGRILPVEGTPMDLRSLKRVGDEVDADFEQMTLVQGYDHNWVLKNHGNWNRLPGRRRSLRHHDGSIYRSSGCAVLRRKLYHSTERKKWGFL